MRSIHLLLVKLAVKKHWEDWSTKSRIIKANHVWIFSVGAKSSA